MPSVKRIGTTSADATVRMESLDGGKVCVVFPEGGGNVPETSLVEAVLEYAHERGLRRTRKPKANGAAKRFRRAKPEMTRPLDNPDVMI